MPKAPDEPPVVHIVDDDSCLGDGLSSLLRSVGLNARTYGSTQEFLRADNLDALGCIVLDIRLPGTNGLDFQEKLVELGIRLPAILMTGHGDIPMSVRAMKAVDFLLEPFRDQWDMIDAVTATIDSRNRRSLRDLVAARARGNGSGGRGSNEQADRRTAGLERGDGQDSPRCGDAQDGSAIARRIGPHGGCVEERTG